MTISMIPLTPVPQTFTIALAGVDYRLTLRWCDAPEGGWMLDMALADGTPLVGGVPLVTGADLLAPHDHLGRAGQGFGGALWVDGPFADAPGFNDLGGAAHLVFETETEGEA